MPIGAHRELPGDGAGAPSPPVEAHHQVTDDALRRTLPGLLRFAAEASARHTYFSRGIGAGQPVAVLEEEWKQAGTTRSRISLALFGDRDHALDQWARAPYLKSALNTVGAKMHHGLAERTDPRQAARDVERMVADIDKVAR